jgi:hypothetical protein
MMLRTAVSSTQPLPIAYFMSASPSGYNVGMPAPEVKRVDGPTTDGEKLCHIVPEEDPDTALCGKDVTGWPWNPPWPFCVVCLDLAGYEVTG